LLPFVFAVIGVPMLIGWLSVMTVFGNTKSNALRPEWGYYDFRFVGHYLVLGLAFLVMQTVSFTETNVDSLIVGWLIGTDLVPSLDVYSKLFNYVPALISIAAFPLWPAIASANAHGDKKWISNIRKWGYFSFGSLAFITSIIIFWQSKNIVVLWTHQELMLDKSIVIGMAVFSTLSAIGTMQSMILGGLGVIKQQASVFLIYVIVLLAAKILFAYFFGVTAMFLVLNIIFLCRLIYTEKVFNMSTSLNAKTP
jgi:O-antigen/teichoic acid export membrane protein